MNTQDDTPAGIPPRRRHPAAIAAIIIAIIIAGIITATILPSRWHPTLEVKNTGTNAVTITFKGETFVCQPGQTWRNSFYAGDTVTLRAGEAVDAPSITVALPERNPKPWALNPTAQLWTAEVNADDPKNIRFENRRFEEVTSPRSASEPWP